MSDLSICCFHTTATGYVAFDKSTYSNSQLDRVSYMTVPALVNLSKKAEEKNQMELCVTVCYFFTISKIK